MTAVKKWQCALAVLMVLVGAPAAHAEPFTFTLLPASGDISGQPGSTIGWEYSITNDSATDWLMLMDINHDPFAGATPDSSVFDFPILAPGATMLGVLFQITWDALAPIGLTNSGFFVLSAEFWDFDPLDGGNFLSFADDQSASYSATVTAAPAPVPEPGTLLLMGSGAVVALFGRNRKRRQLNT